MHPDYLLDQLSSHQLSEWMAYARAVGLPEARAELRSGSEQALLANINRDPKSEAYAPEAFGFKSALKAEVDAEDAVGTDEQSETFDAAAHSKMVAAMLGKKDE